MDIICWEKSICTEETRPRLSNPFRMRFARMIRIIESGLVWAIAIYWEKTTEPPPLTIAKPSRSFLAVRMRIADLRAPGSKRAT